MTLRVVEQCCEGMPWFAIAEGLESFSFDCIAVPLGINADVPSASAGATSVAYDASRTRRRFRLDVVEPASAELALPFLPQSIVSQLAHLATQKCQSPRHCSKGGTMREGWQ